MLLSGSPKNSKLTGVVERFWCVSDPAAEGMETVLPSGKVQIMFSLSDVPLAALDPIDDSREAEIFQVIQGPTSVPRSISRKPQKALCGVAFCAGAAAALGIDVAGTADRIIDLSTCWGEEAQKLRAHLCQLNSDHARLELLEAEISRRIGDTAEFVRVQQAIAMLVEGANIAKICEALGYTPYLLRKTFLKNVGFTPKLYLRIERFRTAAGQLSETSTLADVAAARAFSDQAHMTREVDHFAAMTPKELRGRKRPYVGHVPED